MNEPYIWMQLEFTLGLVSEGCNHASIDFAKG